MSLRDAEALLADFNASRVSVEEAFEVIKAGPKPWTTKDWKDRRALVIQEKCERCGSDEKPMVLQHLWHRRNWGQHCYSASIEVCSLENGPKVRDEEYMEERPCCPKCGSHNVRYRKMAEEWVCQFRHTVGQKYLYPHKSHPDTFLPHERLSIPVTRPCGHVFSDPVYRPVLNEKKRAEAQRDRWADWKAGSEDARKQIAMRLMLEEAVRYWSFDRTETWCKRCAASMDLPLVEARWILPPAQRYPAP